MDNNPMFSQLMNSKKALVNPKIDVLSSHLAILDKVLAKKHEGVFKKFKN